MKKRGLSLLLAIIMVATVFSPAFPFLGIFASAASTFPVELAFNNIFIFEDWATNSLSSTVIVDGVAQSKDANLLVTDIENGSFRLYKKNMAAAETYTAFSMSTDDAAFNSKYYMMPVEPNTQYTFSYNVTGTIWEFTPFVFMYDNQGFFDGTDTMAAYGTPGYGNNSFEFTTPADVTSIQIRFTIGDDTASRGADVTEVYADVSNIAIYKTELKDAYFAAEEAEIAAQKKTQNDFRFDEWAEKATSLPCGLGTTGTIEPDTVNDTVKFTTRAIAGDSFFTPLGIDGEASNVGFYTVEVSPNTSYSLTYDIGDNTLPGAVHCQPWIVEMNSSGVALNYFNYETPGLKNNRKDFTTSDKTTQIQIVFNIINDAEAISRYCVVENIGVYKTEFLDSLPTINYNVDFETITGHPHRAAYSYTTGGTNGAYGELPEPSYVPVGHVFAGWYTGENGAGERISSTTEISYTSYTVYPKYEPQVDSLTVTTPPTKTEYTLGEKLNTTGLVLTATQDYTVDEWTDADNDGVKDDGEVVTKEYTNTFNINSGYRCTPEYLTTEGTQTITVEYGGKTATFDVNVSPYNERNIIVNGATHPVTVTNNNYTIEYSATPFNRYELTYYSDCYVKGVITMDADTEEFFLEPSDNGQFASYIDSFLRGIKHYSVITIEFTCLDKEFGNFDLFSITTIDSPVPSDPTQYYQNDEYKVGISLDYGGVVSYIEDLDDDVSAAVYNENGRDITKVDYTSKLPSGAIATSNSVNLINTNDRGRYLQQSYYGTDQPPYEMGIYNGLPWSYNPVQGGNISTFDPETGDVIKGAEASKVIDYRITADQIYIKTRPLDWGKNSEDYPDSYVTDSYMEAWYTFENGMIKTTCRFVDFSGYPSNTTTQEYPALYTIEPLNHFVYNETTKADAWNTSNINNIEEPDFWGVLPEYNALLKSNGMSEVDVDVDCYENWAAFTASEDADSFGIGVYSAGITDFHYGVFPAIYNEEQVELGNLVENYRHATSLDPAVESPTSYISPIGTMTFESYKPSTYSFYVTTGTADQIREDFRKVESIESGEALAQTKVAVPETVYMTPADGASTIGEIYVNNVLDSNDYYNVKTLAEREDNMYFGIHIADAAYFTVDVSNATNSANDINLCTTGGSAVSTTQQFTFDPNDNFINDGQYELRFSGTGLNPGEKATAKWDITVTMDDGSTQKYTYYTVMYAPERTVGAVAEGRYDSAANTEISSWITGANGVDHSQRAPLGSFYGDYYDSGYFKLDPLAYPDTLPTGGTSESEDDYIYTTNENGVTTDGTSVEYTDYSYVMQTATNGSDGSRSQSYLGLLTVDKSRYTNTNQIPNLKMGYDVLRVGSNETDSLGAYTTYYTLGTADSYTSTSLSDAPSGWTVDFTGTEIAKDNASFTDRRTVVPSYSVSDIDGKYIHAVNQAMTESMNIFDWVSSTYQRHATAGTSVLCSVTDKSVLRESVLTGYGVTDTNPEFDEALKKAATVLGDPSATQEEIDNASKELNDAMKEKVDTYYALKYDNIFSAYEYSQFSDSMTVVADRGTATYNNGTITVVNGTITGGEAYTNYGSGDGYYHVTLQPNKEYVFEFDVTTTLKAQAFMFFYDANGNGVAPTAMQVKVNDGAWKTSNPGSGHWGVYPTEANAHYAIKFTTGANTVMGGFRFGNTSNDPVTSTFSNIRLVDAAHYYEDATYSKTEETFKEYSSYGAMITPVRVGYTFTGWKDASGNAVTGADIATAHTSVYSTWEGKTYTVIYNKNGADVEGSADAKQTGYFDTFSLPDNFSRKYYKFRGWAYTADATAPDFAPGQMVSMAKFSADKIDSNNSVTLYAVWERGYSLYFSPNNGTGEIPGSFMGYTEPHNIPQNTTITRTGYTFLGWSLDQNATKADYVAGDTLTVSKINSNYIQEDANDSNEKFVVLHAVWAENKYTIVFNANGGTGTIADKNVTYTQSVVLPSDGVLNMANKLALKGWATTPDATEPTYLPGQTVSKLTSEANDTVTLYAVWYAPGKINVTFDNLVDISQWSTTAGNGTIVNPTDIGFTVKSNEGAGESTCSSAYFPITAGHNYVVELDIKGTGWDVYIFFCDANGNWVEFSDATNHFSHGYNVTNNGIHYTSTVFTAPAGAVKAQLRVDANNSNNAVRFENIRVYDTANTTYLNTVNKYVEYGEAYGELPVPVKDGYQFLGWVDEDGNTVTAESIMNSLDTVYLTSTWAENTNTANEDTVVIEYGCSVTINVLANDKGGTVSGIGTAGNHSSMIASGELDLGVGKATFDAANGTITFTPSNTNVTEEIVFYYELNVSGTYYYAKVTIIPATTIYFEDTFFDFADSTVTKNGTTYNYNWQNLGTPYSGVTQSADRPGTFNFYDNADVNNVYGYDPKSDGQVSYSGGSVHFVEVDQIAGTSAPTATFTFTGTGFDLFSVTDNKSGTVTVTIYEGTDTTNRVMGIMSNTYFGYTHDAESDSLIAADNGALLQVPVIRAHDLDYGTYTVVVQPRYNRVFDVANTGKSGVYVDSVRIYDPMGNENAVANDAYMSDGEYAPQYLEVRDTLVASNKDGSFTISDLGLGKSVFLDGGKTSMDDFANLGPKNEVYLQNGNSVAFHIVTDRADLPSTIQMGMKLTGKGDNTATVKLMNSEYNGWSENITLNSTEERYYNIEAVVDWVQQPDGTYKTASPVIVTNTSDAIISLTSVKWAFDSADNAVTALNLMSDMDTVELAKAAIMRMSDPQVDPQQTILNKDNISYAFVSESYAPGDVGTLTITTEQGVSGVTVNATEVLDCVTNADGKLEWTFEFTAESADSMTFEIIARNEDGITSEAVYATIAIEDDVADDGENDATEPDDGTSDDTTVDSGSGIGDVSFATNLVTKILALIMKVFELLLGGVMA